MTKTRKPETKCRRLPEPQHSLCMRFTVRFVEACHCRSATLPGTTSSAATRVTEVTRFIREYGFTGTSSPGVSPGMRAAMVGLGLALAQPDRRVLVVTGHG